MSIQFAGSNSVDSRRRRRLAVNVEDIAADGPVADEGVSKGLLSELVESEAAAPWVPVYEWRIWTYAALMALVVFGAAFALCMPMAFRPELAPVTRHLLMGHRPILAVCAQATFLFLSAQLALLISWYRCRCKIDFRGRYRIWPWAAAFFAIAAFSTATNAHGLLGQILVENHLKLWRAQVSSWILLAVSGCVPIALLLDRDVRRSRSSLYTLRLSWLLHLTSVGMELFGNEVSQFAWTDSTRVILPMVAGLTLFVGLWLHARIVAYVCPDPPEIVPGKPFLREMAIWKWMASLILRPVKGSAEAEAEAEADAKPKRGRKKATADDEESTTKRKRRAPAKRATKPRTRVKPAETEEEIEEEVYEEPAETSEADESTPYEAETDSSYEESEWNEEPEQEVAPPPVNRSHRETSSNSYGSSRYSAPTPAPVAPAQPAPSDADAVENEDEEGDDTFLRHDNGSNSDPYKGLSKRQKRELRKQARDQQRNQRR